MKIGENVIALGELTGVGDVRCQIIEMYTKDLLGPMITARTDKGVIYNGQQRWFKPIIKAPSLERTVDDDDKDVKRNRGMGLSM